MKFFQNFSLLAWIKVILLVGFVLYLPALSGPFFWDDDSFIVNNKYVTNFDLAAIFQESTSTGAGEETNYYRPITSLSFAIDWMIWGENPVPYQVSNNLLHSFVGIALLILFFQLGMPLPVAGFLGLLFVIHPLQPESVAYINSRGDSLYALLLISSTIAFTRGLKLDLKLKSNTQIDKLIPKQFWHTSTTLYAFSIVLFLASVLSKEIAMAGLGLFGLVGIHLLLSNFKLKNISQFVPQIRTAGLTFIALCSTLVGYLFVRVNYLNFTGFNYSGLDGAYIESVYVRFLTFGKIFLTYLQLTLIPHPIYYERTSEIISQPNHWVLLAGGLIIGVFALGYVEFKRTRRTWIWFGWCWFLGMLAPVSGIVPLNSLLYGHWLYLPLIGVWIVVWASGLLIIAFLKQLKPMIQKTASMVSLGIIAVFSVLSYQHILLWNDPVALYQNNLKYYQAPKILNNYCVALLEENQLDEAVQICSQAIQHKSPFAHANLAEIYKRQDNLELYEQTLLDGIAAHPRHFLSRQLLVSLYLDQDRYQEAVRLTDELLEINSNNWQYWFMKGRLVWDLGDRAEAEVYFDQALILSRESDGVSGLIDRLKNKSN